MGHRPCPYLSCAYVIGMNKPILVPTSPEDLAPAAPPPPYTPEFLDALTAEQRQAPEIKEFWRRMHNSGAKYVSWLFWRYQSKVIDTPLLPRQGSVFFLDTAAQAGQMFR